MTDVPRLILLGDSIFDNAAYTAGRLATGCRAKTDAQAAATTANQRTVRVPKVFPSTPPDIAPPSVAN